MIFWPILGSPVHHVRVCRPAEQQPRWLPGRPSPVALLVFAAMFGAAAVRKKAAAKKAAADKGPVARGPYIKVEVLRFHFLLIRIRSKVDNSEAVNSDSMSQLDSSLNSSRLQSQIYT